MDIKSVIQSHGLKVQEVASRMEIKQSTLSGLFTGNPTVETLHKIAKAVGCSVAEFFYDELPAGTQPPSPMAQQTIHLDKIGDMPIAPCPVPPEKPEKPATQAVQQAIVCPHCGGAMAITVTPCQQE